MATEVRTGAAKDLTADEKVAKLRELFADAPEVGSTAGALS
jgi:hypothetical protein